MGDDGFEFSGEAIAVDGEEAEGINAIEYGGGFFVEFFRDQEGLWERY